MSVADKSQRIVGNFYLYPTTICSYLEELVVLSLIIKIQKL